MTARATRSGAHPVAYIFSKVTWNVLTVLALLIVGAITAQASGVLILDKVLSGSMEPTIMTGDYVLSRHPSGHDLRRGAVITYSNPLAYDGLSITHRVKDLEAGRAVMQGDNNPGVDPYAIAESDVQRVVVGHVGGAGARVIEQFVPTPQWRSDLQQVIHDGDATPLRRLLIGAPWGLAGALLLMLITSLVDLIVLRPRDGL